MRPSRLLAALAAAAVSCLLPGVAAAGFFPGETIDGPSADIRSLGDLDLAHEGTGAVAYVRRESGVDHIFVARLARSGWQPPERVDVGLDAPGSQPVIAASDGGRIVVAFISGGRLFVVVKPASGNPYLPPVALADGASNPSIAMSYHGVGYVSYTTGAGDVRAARMERTGTTFTPLPDPLDISPGAAAGVGAGRSRVAVSADGTGVVTWGEAHPDGRMHVCARRVFDGRASTAPQDLTLNELQGRKAGSADSPDIDIEDDSSFAWAVFRQAFDDGHVHAIARRLVGSQFEAPVQVDGLGLPASEDAQAPRIDLSGRGDGVAASGGSAGFGAYAGIIHDDIFAPSARLDGGNTIPPFPVGAVAENGDTVVAWQQAGPLGQPTVHARYYDNDPASRKAATPQADTLVSAPELGPVATGLGFDAASDRTGNVAIAFLQGGAAERRLVAGSYDRLPQAFRSYTAASWRKFARPQLRWQEAFDLWGPVTYRVEIGGRVVGQTTALTLVPEQPVPDGKHLWKVVAIDRHGQSVTAPSRLLRVDSTPPRVRFRIKGVRKRRKPLRVEVRAADVLNPVGSGVRVVRIRFGDGSATVTARAAAHRYPRGGRYTIRVSATDRAGNVTVVKRRIRVAK